MDFDDFLKNVKDGDLLEWSCNSFFGRYIRLYTKKCVNHSASIYLKNRVPYVIDWEIGNNCKNRKLINIKDELLKYDNSSLYWLKLKDEYDKYRKKYVREILKLEKLKYNNLGIIKIILGKSKINVPKSTVFCSQAIHIALIKCRLLPIIYNNKNSLKPGEFFKTELYEEPKLINIR